MKQYTSKLSEVWIVGLPGGQNVTHGRTSFLALAIEAPRGAPILNLLRNNF
jgi:hypothetical protein